jgi:hypothetical protein
MSSENVVFVKKEDECDYVEFLVDVCLSFLMVLAITAARSSMKSSCSIGPTVLSKGQ